MTKRNKMLIVGGVVLLLVVPFVLAKLRGGELKKIEAQGVETRLITPTILASGALTYQTEIRMVSEVIGRVKKLAVKEGDEVKRGDLLLQLDPAAVQAQVDALEASLQQSRLAIDRQRLSAETLETKWKRYQQLRESGVIDANTYDEIRTQRDQAKVELSSTQQQTLQTGAQLKQMREQLAKTELRAPISGRVTQLTIKIGETAVPSVTSIAGSDLLTIADTSNMYAEVNVNETDVARVQPGQKAHIVPAAFANQSWIGTVETVAVSPRNVAGQGKSYLVKIRLDPSEKLQFHTGMSCRAEIETRGAGATPVVAVPVQAVSYEEAKENDQQSKASVFVIEGGRARKRLVETGIADDAFIAIDKGVAVGARIVTGPARVLRFLKDGERVEELPAAAAGSVAMVEDEKDDTPQIWNP